MERHLDDELQKLNKQLLVMASMTEEAIHNSTEALITQNKNLAKSVVEQDMKIDELELDIEEQSIELLALFQPLAKDLRFITTGMHINSQLERISDLTVNISQRVIEMPDIPGLKNLTDMPKLAQNTKWMLKNAIDSFVKKDEELAKSVILSDKESNKLRTSIINELVNEYMVKDSRNVPWGVSMLFIARDLERISDYAASIAEDVIYMIQAKVIRHHRERLLSVDVD